MRSALPRRLALVTVPHSGEAFGSWVDRMARLNRCPAAEVADLLGLRLRGASADVRPPVFGVRSDESLRRALYATTGIPGSLVDGMHLSVFEGGPLNVSAVLSAGKSHRPAAGREWAEVYGSRACPSCLLVSGGVWRLWWKLSCAAVCPEHPVLLLDRCPSCGGVLRWPAASGHRRRPPPALARPWRGPVVPERSTADGRSHQDRDGGRPRRIQVRPHTGRRGLVVRRRPLFPGHRCTADQPLRRYVPRDRLRGLGSARPEPRGEDAGHMPRTRGSRHHARSRRPHPPAFHLSGAR
ncbi:TniQ family protein [Streptomyces sp. NPDC086080]|uniref:TniQ family protein n=1 Tax=Streptomyces sp. NPDC086080 TaxID=3365748 RepID=UPI0037CF2F50